MVNNLPSSFCSSFLPYFSSSHSLLSLFIFGELIFMNVIQIKFKVIHGNTYVGLDLVLGKFPVKLAPSLNKTRRDKVVTKSEYQISALFISQSEIIFRTQARIIAQQNKEGRGCQKVRISYLSFSHQPV